MPRPEVGLAPPAAVRVMRATALGSVRCFGKAWATGRRVLSPTLWVILDESQVSSGCTCSGVGHPAGGSSVNQASSKPDK